MTLQPVYNTRIIEPFNICRIMATYTFRLLGPDLEDTGAFIADGNSKQTATNKARRYMQENGIPFATLEVSSNRTYNLLDVIDITL